MERHISVPRCAPSNARLLRPGSDAHHRTEKVREARHAQGSVRLQTVDTCAGEFEASTTYMYSTYETENEAAPTDRRKLSSSLRPNRIGQCIVRHLLLHASFALRRSASPPHGQLHGDGIDRLRTRTASTSSRSRSRLLEIVDLEKPEGMIVHSADRLR